MNDGKICVSVCAETGETLFENVNKAQELADVVEVRFDCMSAGRLSEVRSKISKSEFIKPLLATFRAPGQGGNGTATRDERLGFWGDGVESFWKFDIEEDIAGELGHLESCILSFHDFSGVPYDIDDIFTRLAAAGTDIIKMAVTTADVTDGLAVWKLMKRAKADGKDLIPIAMGEAGKWTRILGLAHGAVLTYASLDAGGETAPGQVSVRDLIDTYRARQLDMNTRVFGIIGDPVSQSMSPVMQNPAFVAAGIDAVFIPLLVKDLDAFMRRMVKRESREAELNFGGFSVTMPHKQTVMKYLDAIDQTAKMIGAVNTVKIEGDKLTGYNTDSHGFITPLKHHFGELKDAKVAVAGAGGAARACVYALIAEGAEVEILVRDIKRAQHISEEFGISARLISDFKSGISRSNPKSQKPRPNLSNVDIVVNATPMGMAGPFENESLFTADELEGVRFVYDLVTKPYDTPIISEAKKAGIPAIGGLEMLVSQGAKQFEIWTGLVPSVEMMRQCVLRRMREVRK